MYFFFAIRATGPAHLNSLIKISVKGYGSNLRNANVCSVQDRDLTIEDLTITSI